MIIKPKNLPFLIVKWGGRIPVWIFRRFFNKMVVNGAELRPGHSYLLMCNHFSFFDGFLAHYLILHHLNKNNDVKGIYMMSLRKQMEKNWWLKYLGAFSVEPGIRSLEQSLEFAAEILSKPGNLLIFYPQAELETSHIRHIEFKEGVSVIVPKIKGNCQLLWCSILIDWFESLKPSGYFKVLDCGTNNEFDFDALKEKVNEHHKQAIQNLVRFTKEP